MTILNSRHLALVVTDIETAISLYETLGANLESRDIEKGDFIEQLVSIPNVVLETCKMRLLDNSRLELIQVLYPPFFKKILLPNKTNKFEPKSGLNKKFDRAYCLNHIAFTVEDINKSIKVIESYGGYLASGPIISTKAHSKNAVYAKHAYIYDPSGNLLHIAQDLEYGKIQ